ncbi:MAG TPA: DUF512 domain-containing protein [Phycisphaerales bacterium]|nr:DUF512 domain-containing protein [Phycisphaerales bacterium]
MLGGVITRVTGGLAERVGLQAGDALLSINGQPLRDVIDVRFQAATERLALKVHRAGQTFILETERRYGEDMGLIFDQPTFDGVRRCENRCEFCFIKQMPPGLRPSLYVRDDDYRHSFLFGNYVTLTNLDATDWERIETQHLSPLYVSVHATDPALRPRMLGNPAAADLMAQLRRLAGLGVEVHTQIVVIPGVNDGAHLDRSIGDLAGLYPAVRSVSIVPVGLTRFHRGDCRVPTDEQTRAVWEQVTGWQGRLQERLRVNFAYLADEWYLRQEHSVPPAEHYDGLDLTENGVGLVRRFLDNLEPLTFNPQPLTLVTGTLFAPILRSAIGPSADAVPVVNHFFGPTVTVAGLLTGRDVIAQLSEREMGETIVLPGAMFGGPEGQSLDGMWPREIAKALGRRIVLGWPGGET